jgi:hypothetical protein
MSSTNTTDIAVKIACLGIVGLLLGAYIAFVHVDAGAGVNLACALAIAVVFKLLALRYGDGFWRAFRNLVRALIP